MGAWAIFACHCRLVRQCDRADGPPHEGKRRARGLRMPLVPTGPDGTTMQSAPAGQGMVAGGPRSRPRGGYAAPPDAGRPSTPAPWQGAQRRPSHALRTPPGCASLLRPVPGVAHTGRKAACVLTPGYPLATAPRWKATAAEWCCVPAPSPSVRQYNSAILGLHTPRALHNDGDGNECPDVWAIELLKT
jgi:hypothetical protein